MIIGVCGLIGCGKGTVADVLVDEHGFKKISFADKLKDAVSVMFDWPREMLEGDTADSRYWREQEDTFWTQETGRKITPRLVLQEFGTDCMRNGFYDGIWVSFVKKTVIDNPDTNFVIPDVRYQDLGIEPTDAHPSEWRWANIPFDFNIYNEGTIDDLKSQVQGRLASTLRLASA